MGGLPFEYVYKPWRPGPCDDDPCHMSVIMHGSSALGPQHELRRAACALLQLL
jgi:hypothetical protein